VTDGIRIGIDFGGTKIEVVALGADEDCKARVRAETPQTYDLALAKIRELVGIVERDAGAVSRVGLGLPGTETASGVMRNANTLYLNGRTFSADLEAALQKEVRVSNDANCFALSEASDGAGAGHSVVFGAVIGTGCGGGIVVNGVPLSGPHGIGGEWGHNPLPWAQSDELPGVKCWCGKLNCLEVWISGSGFSRDYSDHYGEHRKAQEIVSAARTGEEKPRDALERYMDRLARALAGLVNILDPDVIVLGGGMSNVRELYTELPAKIAHYAFGGSWAAQVLPATWGDSSGVRGAARLWG